ncbi:hypothetical protein A9Z40_03115 [Microbacterium arborescens]|uniref:Uncharacterized protein n=1 Tax=Microbacterium arborescens TaxID=33883 RepID=A0ABX2WIA3_9MICO|nr:hypothetical protein [Microbacterium arborescens]OAZ40945.1 hypothetical protein A9Z40_03115 [Microbacterium arborescens]
MPDDLDAPFASADLMASRSSGAITKESHPFLEDELQAATRAIREFCRWHVAPTLQRTYRSASRTPDDVYLPASQLVSIDAVTIDGREFTPEACAAVEFDPLTGWTNLYGRRVTVTYTAGHAEVPADIVGATLEIAAAGLGTSLGQSREQAGAVSLTFDTVGGGVDPQAALGRRLVPYQIGRLP